MDIFAVIEQKREAVFSAFVDECRKKSVFAYTEEERERAFFESDPWQRRPMLKEQFYALKVVKNGQKTVSNA
ncbi:MAG: hypothetical protein IJV80_00905 [Clostridia bacterium]|nr:hypothetical protein [Clostridia bacterium]